jgi:hypothetical protein
MKIEDFNNKFGGTLHITLNKPSKPVAPMMANQKAQPGSKLVDIVFEPQVYDPVGDGKPKEKDLNKVVISAPQITLVGENGESVTLPAPNGKNFTVGNLFDAIGETERKTRGSSNWMGGIDLHHIYFEGLYEVGNTPHTYLIAWGS